MKKSTKVVLAAAAVAILVAGVQDVMNRETSGLRQAHQAAWPDHTTECEHLQDNGETWALCRFWRSAPSVWVKRGDAWAAANGNAQMVIDAVGLIDTSDPARPYQNLPRLYVDRQSPVYMTDAVLARFEEAKASIKADRG